MKGRRERRPKAAGWTMRYNNINRRRNHVVEWLESRQLLSLGASGWTILQPSSDSRVIYVDNTAGGPGNDNNSGQSTSSPVFSVNKALTLVRSGFPDWVLLKRG